MDVFVCAGGGDHTLKPSAPRSTHAGSPSHKHAGSVQQLLLVEALGKNLSTEAHRARVSYKLLPTNGQSRVSTHNILVHLTEHNCHSQNSTMSLAVVWQCTWAAWAASNGCLVVRGILVLSSRFVDGDALWGPGMQGDG